MDMITAEVSVVPIGRGTSVSREVKDFVQRLRESGLKVVPGPLGTAVEAKNTGELFDALEKAHNACFSNDVKRIITTVKIDDRRDKDSSLDYKLKAIA
jgi:uncharacterized protein (TIGR00106 family)